MADLRVISVILEAPFGQDHARGPGAGGALGLMRPYESRMRQLSREVAESDLVAADPDHGAVKGGLGWPLEAEAVAIEAPAPDATTAEVGDLEHAIAAEVL